MSQFNALYDFYIAMNKCLEYLNKHVFDEQFKEVVFMIQGERAIGLNTYGVYWPDKWKINDKTYSEISLTAEMLTNNDLNELLNTLIHEMIHFKANLLGIRDTDKSGKHHNKEFKKLGEEIGCVFGEKNKKIGYSNFKFNSELQQIVNNCIKELELEKFIGEFKRIRAPKQKTIKKFFKYVCPACNATIRATLGAEIICGTDGVVYEFRDKMPIDED
ncbi:SprT-like domain-containing protein [Mycoplasmoides pirum]|uniref:SprT-like domain-containing protein n=1 Tax=Mycoplasmoides pirum TaxID=2122 RepID=UPI000487FD1E|nr:SprT-like domain-containing protein [Mycoplasmoides pirum]